MLEECTRGVKFSDAAQHIVGKEIVAPGDMWVLDDIDHNSWLTLTSCHPRWSDRQRIVVRAVLVSREDR